jgi:hypothetical protein
MKLIAPFFAAVCLLAASAGASTGTSGLYGKVTRGPITPICTAEQPCSGPAANTTLVFSLAGQDVARTRTHADGTYRVALAPGTYTVRALATRPIEPVKAWVRRDHFRKVDFSIDTGIR